MAGSVNKVILVGNLGRDPEIRQSRDGKSIANLAIATSESWRDKTSGEKRERTEWHRVVVFSDNLAQIAEKYLRKGMKVYIEGQLQTRKWSDDAGTERYTTEIVLQGFNAVMTMLDGKEHKERGVDVTEKVGRGHEQPLTGQKPADRSFDRDLNDEIPF